MDACKASANGTLLERSTRYVMLLRLSHGRDAEQIRRAMATTVRSLPRHLTRSITWDQGSETVAHGAFTTATDIRSTSVTRPALAARLRRKHPPACSESTLPRAPICLRAHP